MRFGEWLKRYKADHDLTIPKIAEMIGVPESSICHHLYCGNVPAPRTFSKYRCFFGTNDPKCLEGLYDYFWDEERAYRMRKADGDE